MSNLSNRYSDGNLREPLFFKQPPYHPFNAEKHGVVEGAYGVFAFPLPIGRRTHRGTDFGPYPPNAMSWDQFDPRFQHTLKFQLGLHMLTHAFEFKNIGTPTFIGRPNSYETLRAQEAFLRRLMKRPRKGDKDILISASQDHGLEQKYTFDQKIAEALRSLASGAFNDRIPGMQGYVMDPNNIADGMDVDVRDDDDEPGAAARRRHRREVAEMEEEAVEEVVEDQVDEVIREIFKTLMRGPDGESMEGKFIEEKLKIVIVHMTRPVIDEDGHERLIRRRQRDGTIVDEVEMEDAGCVIFFCVMDPLYSVGKAFGNLISMCEQHQATIKGMGDRDDSLHNADDITGKRQWNNNTRSNTGTTRLMKNFPWLGSPDFKGSPLLGLTKELYVDMVAMIKDRPEMVREERQRFLAQDLSDPGTDVNPNILHPLNVFTVEWALEMMASYGVPEDQCSLGVFREQGFEHAWMHEDAGLAKWIFPPEQSYHFLLEAWKWHFPGGAALRQQYYPWITVPRALAKLTAVRTESTALTIYRGTSENDISKRYSEMCIIPDIGIIRPIPIMSYDPNALLRQSAIYCAMLENRLVIDEIRGPRNPRANPEAYAAFCDEIGDMRDACMMRSQHILVPTAHIPPVFKLIVTFMAQEVRKVSTFLPHYTMDPFDVSPVIYPFDSFANYMIREALEVRYGRFIVGDIRHWTMTKYGAFDAYSCDRVSIHYNVIYNGISQGGKSYFAKDATVKTTVPDTVNQMLESSNRAFNTHEDFIGYIIFKDELDNIVVDAKAAENDKTGKAERLKSMITDQKCTYRVLTLVDQASGRQKREGEDIESLFHATMICCTNKKVSRTADEAIASRFLNFPITRSDVDLFEFLGIENQLDDVDKQRNKDFVHMLRIKQCLIALMQALIDTRVLPEPSMDVFNLLNARILSYLKDQGLDTSGVRSAQIVERLVRIYIILNAVIMLYDRPGAKYYGKEFELSQLADAIPFLYATKQITIFALTQAGEIYYHPLQRVVLKACFSLAKFPYKEGMDGEDYVREGAGKHIAWRKHTAKKKGLDGHYVETEEYDFNYITIPGQYRTVILGNVGENCMPKLRDKEVDAELAALEKQFFTVKPLRRVAVDTYRQYSVSVLNAYKAERERSSKRIQVVIRDFQSNEIHIAVEALNHFQENMMVKGFMHCIHKGFRPQMFILGTQLRGKHPSKPDVTITYPGIYQTLEVSQTAIDEFSMGEAFLAPDASYKPEIVHEMLSGERLHPDKVDEIYPADRVKRTKAVNEIFEDLDDYGHREHFYRCGIPGDHEECIGRQTRSFQSIRKALHDLEKKAERSTLSDSERIKIESQKSMLMDYPKELMEVENARILKECHARNFSGNSDNRHLKFIQKMDEWQKLSDADKQTTPMPTEINIEDFMTGGRYTGMAGASETLIEAIVFHQTHPGAMQNPGGTMGMSERAAELRKKRATYSDLQGIPVRQNRLDKSAHERERMRLHRENMDPSILRHYQQEARLRAAYQSPQVEMLSDEDHTMPERLSLTYPSPQQQQQLVHDEEDDGEPVSRRRRINPVAGRRKALIESNASSFVPVLDQSDIIQ